MRKLFNILGSIIIAGSAAGSVVACDVKNNQPTDDRIDLSKMSFNSAPIDRKGIPYNHKDKNSIVLSLKSIVIKEIIRDNSVLSNTIGTDYSVTIKTNKGVALTYDELMEMDVNSDFLVITVMPSQTATSIKGVSENNVKIKEPPKPSYSIADMTSWGNKKSINYSEFSFLDDIYGEIKDDFFENNKDFFTTLGVPDSSSDFLNCAIYEGKTVPANRVTRIIEIKEKTNYTLLLSINTKSSIESIKSGLLYGELTLNNACMFNKVAEKMDLDRLDVSEWNNNPAVFEVKCTDSTATYDDVVEDARQKSFNYFLSRGMISTAELKDWKMYAKPYDSADFYNAKKQNKDQKISVSFSIQASDDSVVLKGVTHGLKAVISFTKGVPPKPVGKFDLTKEFSGPSVGASFFDYANSHDMDLANFKHSDFNGDKVKFDNLFMNYFVNTVLANVVFHDIDPFPAVPQGDYNKYLDITYYDIESTQYPIPVKEFLNHKSVDVCFDIVPTKAGAQYFTGSLIKGNDEQVYFSLNFPS